MCACECVGVGVCVRTLVCASDELSLRAGGCVSERIIANHFSFPCVLNTNASLGLTKMSDVPLAAF